MPVDPREAPPGYRAVQHPGPLDETACAPCAVSYARQKRLVCVGNPAYACRHTERRDESDVYFMEDDDHASIH